MPQIGSAVYGRDDTYKKINMSDYDSNDEMLFTVETRGYLYEPDYTKEKLFPMESERAYA